MDVPVISSHTVSFNTQSGAPAQPLQPGEVLDAVVLAVMDGGKVRLALANTIIDVITKVPLEPGATVRLAVKVTDTGTQLVIVDPRSAATSGKGIPVAANNPGLAAAAPQGPAHPATPATLVQIATGDVAGKGAIKALPPELAAQAEAQPQARAITPAAALATAVRGAGIKQDGLAPLFADLAVAAKSQSLPASVRAALNDLLALRTPLPPGATINGNDVGAKISAEGVKAAFERSGLLFEAKLATSTGADTGNALPAADLKAALTVLKQVVKTWIDGGATPSGEPLPNMKGGPSLVPTLTPLDTPGDELLKAGARANLPYAPGEAPEIPVRLPPAPPARGASPSAQPPALPTLAADAAPREMAHKLLTDTDAALARQTLLQAASLDTNPQTRETSGPRWNFEIPLQTPQGTAIAQFEIARDGSNGNAVQGVDAVWRVRFTLDVEPMGPVHAQVSLIRGQSGTRTAVTLWAERPESASQLRQSTIKLAGALKEADLEPGDLTVRDGTPPRPRDAVQPAGRFVDRAS